MAAQLISAYSGLILNALYGTGKSTLARVIASMVADDFNTIEIDSTRITPAAHA